MIQVQWQVRLGIRRAAGAVWFDLWRHGNDRRLEAHLQLKASFVATGKQRKRGKEKEIKLCVCYFYPLTV